MRKISKSQIFTAAHKRTLVRKSFSTQSYRSLFASALKEAYRAAKMVTEEGYESNTRKIFFGTTTKAKPQKRQFVEQECFAINF